MQDGAESELVARIEAVLPSYVRAVCTRLADAGYQAVAVGGAVRDAILGREPGDWDVATSAPPDDVMALFPRSIPTGLQHGTVTVVDRSTREPINVEVTTFRGEGAYTDSRRPDHVRFGVPLVEDLARRDLRVNAMAYDPAKRELVDPYAGLADLREGLLRAVGPTGDVYEDAVARFTEDGLRVMRAVRFAAVLEVPLHPDTVRGIVPALPSLAKVSRERVSDELRKLLATGQPSRGLRDAHATGIIASIIPALETALGGRADRWLARVDAAPLEARLAAFVFDVLAPSPAPGRVDRAGQKQVEGILRALKFTNEELARAAIVAATVGATTVGAWTDAGVRRLLADVTRSHAPIAAAVWRADGATVLADRADAILARGDALALSELAVTGGELMAALSLPPGPQVGKLLAGILDRVLADADLNDRDQLIALAAELTR